MRKGIVGLVILICVFVAVVMSSRGIAVDISQEERLAKIETRLVDAEKKLADIEGRIEKMSAIPAKNVLPAINKSTAQLSPGAKSAKLAPTAGQTVFLNANSDKFHFWTGCTWYGYGTETTLEKAQADGAKPCMLCEMTKVIKQK